MQDRKSKTFLTPSKTPARISKPPPRNSWNISNQENTTYSTYIRQLTQEKEESYDDFATRLKQAAGPCDFPTDWRNVEIQLQLIEKGKSRRVRRRLLSKPHTLTEALDFARAQEMSDKQAERIEIDLQSHGTDTNPEEKLYALGQQAQSKTAGKVCFSCGGTFPHAGGRMKCPARG